jgi:DNA polymerase-1
MLLVDGSSYLYRAFHAMPDLRARRLPHRRHPRHGGDDEAPARADPRPNMPPVCSMPRARRSATPGTTEYKAQRAPMPDDLRSRSRPSTRWSACWAGRCWKCPASRPTTPSARWPAWRLPAGHKVVISTGDKDLAQLVNERVTLINTMSNERLDIAGVKAKFGVPPERIIDYLTLIGDTVDNVPGVDKVGPKTAVKWLAEHGSLDGVVAAAASIKGVAGENLRKALDWLPQGRRLVTVVTDCDLSGHVPAGRRWKRWRCSESTAKACWTSTSATASRAWRKELEELGWACPACPWPGRGCRCAPAPEPAPVQQHVCRVSTKPSPPGSAWSTGWSVCRPPTGGHGHRDRQPRPHARAHRGHQLCRGAGPSRLCAAGARLPGAPDQLPLPPVLATLRPWLEDASRAKVGQNIKYDTHVLANHGITVRGWQHDTCWKAMCWKPTCTHSLEALAERHLGRQGLSYEDLCGKGVNQIPFSQVDIERATTYSGEDSEMTLHVHQTLWPRVAGRAGPACMSTATSRCRCPRCCSASSATACWSMRRAGPAEPATGRAHGGAGAGRLRHCRPALQHGQPQADRRHPLHQAGPAGEEEDRLGRTQHR